MVEERLRGNVEDVLLQLFQVAYAQNLLVGFRIAYYKIAETEIFHDGIAKVHGELL